MRLNKFIADKTAHSRRQADKLIENGQIFVNDKPAVMGHMLQHEDTVTYQKKSWIYEIDIDTKDIKYVAFNKPMGIETTCNRDIGRSIINYLEANPKYMSDYAKHRLYPVGRLDIDSRGLILLTNDGNLTYKLSHPSFACGKEYKVRVEKPITIDFIQGLRDGVLIFPYRNMKSPKVKTKPAKVFQLDAHTFKITLEQGLNRQIRKSVHELGNKVLDLKRIAIHKLRLKDLDINEGEFCQLEYNLIKSRVSN